MGTARPKTPGTGATPGGLSRGDIGILALVLALCGVVSYLRWTKMESLTSGDPARWLFEAMRVSRGEFPYRDFAWQYPPLAVLSLGWAMKSFGATFLVAQLFIDAVSVGVVICAYLWIRILLPRFLWLPVLVCLVAVSSTSLMFFNLFSFATYVPALQIGAIGFLLFLMGVIAYLRSGRTTSAIWSLLAVGAFVAIYSKPETLIATVATLFVLSIGDRVVWFSGRSTHEWLLHYAKLGLVCAGPALIVYLWTGFVAGFSNLWAGMAGYGQAASGCPWWPTGIGVFGAAASLGEALFIAAAFSLTRRRQFVLRFGSSYYYGLAAGLGGFCLFIGYVLESNWNLLTGSRPALEKLVHAAPSTVWSNAVLLPVMWSCLSLWCYLLLRMFFSRAGSFTRADFFLLIVLAGPVAMSARGWFNWIHGTRTNVPGICYPFFLVLGPYLIWRLLMLAGPGKDLDAGFFSRPGIALVTLVAVYGLVRIVAAYPSQFSDQRFRSLETLAGTVHLANYDADSEIYRFVLENTTAQDAVLDLPYGGGINFAAHRPSPFFDTQFRYLRMSDKYLEKDLSGLRRSPPKVVIGDNAPNYGAIFGLEDGCTCAFPSLVWVPARTSAQRDKTFPAMAAIQQDFRVARVVGQKLLLIAK